MIWSVNANSIKLGSLLHDNSPVYSRIYQHDTLGHVIMWAGHVASTDFGYCIFI